MAVGFPSFLAHLHDPFLVATRTRYASGKSMACRCPLDNAQCSGAGLRYGEEDARPRPRNIPPVAVWSGQVLRRVACLDVSGGPWQRQTSFPYGGRHPMRLHQKFLRFCYLLWHDAMGWLLVKPLGWRPYFSAAPLLPVCPLSVPEKRPV